jgi:YD repeat-containing protein
MLKYISMPGVKVIPIIISAVMFFAAVATAQPNPLPAGYNNTIKVNYVRVWEASAPEDDPAILVTRSLKDVKQSTSYFDGLARLLQTVKKEAALATGNSSADLVTPVIYDAFGRETYKYAPFAANGTGGNLSVSDGLFKLNPFPQQVGFYNNQLNGQAGETLVGPNQLNWAYSQTVYEASALNRVEAEIAPGSSWVGAGRGVASKHWFNTAIDEVRIWQIDDVPGGLGNYKTPPDNGAAVYAAGEISKYVTVNEAGKQLIEFKDKEGQLILRKLQLTAAADNGSGSDHNGWLCTYYLYDDLNNLRCVIQPSGVEWLADHNWNINDPNSKVIDEQCFRYAYDTRNRLIMKKVPGAGTTQMVYDTRDRLVLMQDANMAQASQMQWLVTKHDELNRPVATYLITDAAYYNNADHYRNSSVNLTALLSGLNSNDQLTELHYDNYDGISGFSTASLYASDYGPYLDAATGEYPEPMAVSKVTKGLLTWSKIRVVGGNTYITTCNLYDNKGRVIQTQTINYTGAMDIVTNQYNFSGQLIRNHIKHQKGVTAIQSYNIGTKNVYDDLGRLVRVEKNLNGAGWKQIAAMTYDALGQLKTKKLAPAFNNNAGLETLTHDYNVRGWLSGINKNYLSSSSNTSSYFGMELNYDKDGYTATANKQYNGNIASTVWRSQGDGERRKYDFSYDAASRLLKADFNQQFGSQWAKTDPSNSGYIIDFSTHIGDGVNPTSAYDANGNIIQLQQWGLKLNNSPQIDNLTYNYLFNSSNRLARVTDGFSDPNTKLGDFKDGNNAGTDDYSYDPNGNILMDNNKNISSISYNHLNLPEVVTVSGKGTVTYTYDAAGNKLKKETVDNTVTPAKTTTTLYVNAFVYENDVLQFISHEEGRIRYTPATETTEARFNYDYFVKDHLGNVRMVLTDERKQDVYPAATLENVTYNNGTAFLLKTIFTILTLQK